MKTLDKLVAKQIKAYSDAMMQVKEAAIKQLMKMGAALNELEFEVYKETGKNYLVWRKKNLGFEFREERIKDVVHYIAVPVYMEKAKEKVETE